MKRKDYEKSKNDGVLLQGLDNLRKGLITLRDTETNISLEVGNKVYAASKGGAA